MKEVQATALSEIKNIKFFSNIKSQTQQNFSLIRYFWGPEKPPIQTIHPNLRICQLGERFSLAYSQNHLQLFEVSCEQNQADVVFKSYQNIVLDQPIHFVCCNNKTSTPITLVIIQLLSQIQLYRLDYKEQKLTYRCNYWLGNINSIAFLSPLSVFAVAQANQLWEFDCSNQKITKKTMVVFKTHQQSQYGVFVKGFILGSTEQIKEQYKIYYFYTTFRQGEQCPIQTLMIKQFKKKGVQIKQLEVCAIKDNEIKKFTSLSKGKIFMYQDSFILALEEEIVIIQKIHQQYHLVDNIRKRTQESYMKIKEDGTCCFCNQKFIQICKIDIVDTKCKLENINILECSVFPEYCLQKVTNIKDNCLFYFFKSDSRDKGQMKVGCLVKQDSMRKLQNLSKNGIPPKMFWHLSSKLGVSKKQFFLKQWHNSGRHLSDINAFLFETEDISTIKTQLRMAFHRNSFHHAECINIYNKLLRLIQHRLTEQLSRKLLMQYLKCHFLIRKLKIQPSATIESKNFIEISQKGIIRSLQDLYQHYRNISHMNTKEKEKQGKNIKYDIVMKNMLSEYHIILLENYENDLIQLIKPFSLQLPSFFQKFPFYVPNHPYKAQFIFRTQLYSQDNHHQNNLFTPVKQTLWDEEINIEFLRKQLQKHHSTSLVSEKLSQLINHPNFKKNRLIKHGLILSTKQQYIQKISKLSGNYLYLKICQFNNLKNNQHMNQLQHPIKNQLVNNFKTSNGLLDVFQNKNNLIGESLRQCKFYTEMHWLLLHHQISSIDINSLVKMNDQDIIAMFFLGNKQKNQLILGEVKSLYEQYVVRDDQSSNAFDDALNNFVVSNICSPVQIKQIFLQLIKRGPQFQDQHQQVINIILNGYCYRTEVREASRMNELIEECLMNIKLCQVLNERVMKIMKIIDLYDLFHVFDCDTISIYDIQNKGKDILNVVLENFFLNKTTQNQIVLDELSIPLDHPRNMLNVLLYIHEKLYSDSEMITQYEILMMYGLTLIQYQCFPVLQKLFKEEEALQTLNVNNIIFSQDVISKSLMDIYKDPEIGTFNDLKFHMGNILDLYVSETQYVMREKARFKIGEIVSNCGYEITPHQLYNINNVEDFMDELIENCYQQLTLDMLAQVNACFNKLSNQGGQFLDDGWFLTEVALFTKLLVQSHSQKAIDSIIFLMQKDCFDQLQNLFTEALLQTLAIKYPQQTIISRKIIEYYILSHLNYPAIINMFKSNFSINSILDYQNQIDLLQIHQSYFYLYLKSIYVKLEHVREVAKMVSKNTQQFYRYYYFVIAIIGTPDRGSNICDIQYDYQVLEGIVELVGQKLLQQEKHSILGTIFNLYLLKKNFFIGLCQVGCNLVNIDQLPSQTFEKISDESQYSNLFGELKQQKHTNLLKVIKKSLLYLQQNETLHKVKLAKSKEYKQSIDQKIQDIQIKKKQIKEDAQSVRSIKHSKSNKTLTFREFRDDYLNASVSYPQKNQKQIINIIFRDRSVSHVPKTQKRYSFTVVPISPKPSKEKNPVFPEIIQTDNSSSDIIDQTKKDQILGLDQVQMIQRLRQYYTKVNISKFVQILENIKRGEERNIRMVQAALRIQPQFDLKQIFTFEFFFHRPEIPNQDDSKETKEYLEAMFEYLSPEIRGLINQNNWLFSRIVCSFFKFQKIYEYRVISFAIQKTLMKSSALSLIQQQSLEAMINKLSLSFIARSFQKWLQFCKSKEVQKFYIELVSQTFNRVVQGTEKFSSQDTQKVEEVKQILQSKMEQLQIQYVS